MSDDFVKYSLQANTEVDHDISKVQDLFGSVEDYRSEFLISQAANMSEPQSLDAMISRLKLAYSLQIDQYNRSFGLTDLCVRPEVPVILRVGSWLWGIVNGTLNQYHLPPLPTGYGITHMPCVILGLSECFKEGAFAYPVEFKILESRMRMLGFPPAFKGLIFPGYSKKRSIYDTADHGDGGVLGYLSAALMKNQINEFSNCSSWSGRSNFPGSLTLSTETRYADPQKTNITAISEVSSLLLVLPPEHVVLKARFPNLTEKQLQNITMRFEKQLAKEWRGKALLQPFNGTQPIPVSNQTDPGDQEKITFLPLMGRSSYDGAMDTYNNTVPLIAAGYLCVGFFLVFFVGYRASGEISELVAYALGYRTTFPFNRYHLVHGNPLLCLFGMFLILMSTGASLGTLALLHVETTSFNWQTAPLFIMGIGIDDMLIIMEHFQNSRVDQRISILARIALEKSGSSVTLTTVCNIVIFGISSIFAIRSIQWFCWQMCIATFYNYVVLIWMFWPVMLWDARRIREGIIDVFPFRRFRGEDAAAKSAEIVEEKERGAGKQLVGKIYHAMLSNKWIIAAVVLCFLAFLGVSIWACATSLSLEDKIKERFNTGSEVYKDFEFLDERLDYRSLIVSTDAIDYPTQQAKLYALYQDLYNMERVVPLTRNNNWLLGLLGWANKSAVFGPLDPETQTLPPEKFYPAMHAYLNGDGNYFDSTMLCQKTIDLQNNNQSNHHNNHNNPSNNNNMNNMNNNQSALIQNNNTIDLTPKTAKKYLLVSCTEPNVTLVGVRAALGFDHVNSVKERIHLTLRQPYEVLRRYNHTKTYLSSIDLGVIDAEADVRYNLTLALVCSLGAVMVLFWICIPSLAAAVVGAICIGVTTVETLAVMAWAGIQLNPYSFVNLVISMSFSIEFTCHLIREFQISRGTRVERTIAAYQNIGSGVFSGVISSWLSILPLIFADAVVQQKYGFGMITIMLGIEFLNDFVFMPIFLSWIGPPEMNLQFTQITGTLDASSKHDDPSNEEISCINKYWF